MISIDPITGEIRVKASARYKGRYPVKISALDECHTELGMYAWIVINTLPKAQDVRFPVQRVPTWQTLYFQVPEDWFTDADN